MYYDPLVDLNHTIPAVFGWLMWGFYLLPNDPAMATRFYEAIKRDYLIEKPDGTAHVILVPGATDDHQYMTVRMLAMANELGDTETVKKLQGHVEANYEPTWDRDAGEFNVFVAKSVVGSVEDPNTQITLTDAREVVPTAELEELVEIPVEVPTATGRIAAQTAKQVILQRLRDAEREKIYEEYVEKEGEVVTSQIQRFEPSRYIIVDINQVEAVLPPYEQVPFERLRPHQRLKVYVSEVRRTPKGPEIIVSRAHKNLLKRLLEIEDRPAQPRQRFQWLANLFDRKDDLEQLLEDPSSRVEPE